MLDRHSATIFLATVLCVDHLVLRLDEALALVLREAERAVDDLHDHDGAVHPEGAVEAEHVHEVWVELGRAEHVDRRARAADTTGVRSDKCIKSKLCPPLTNPPL